MMLRSLNESFSSLEVAGAINKKTMPLSVFPRN